MHMRVFRPMGWALLWLGALTSSVSASQELKLLPPEATLIGPESAQRLIVEAEADGQFVGALTDRATFTSSDPAVATIDPSGMLRPAGDGEATITATVDGRQATARVKVSRTKDPFTW